MVLFVSDDDMVDHVCPWPNCHNEMAQRLKVIHQRIEDCDFGECLEYLSARRATEEEVTSVHTERYIEELKQTPTMCLEDLETFSKKYEDNYMNRETFDLSLIAAGCAIDLTAEVWKQKTCGFAAIRPPGHHASPDAGFGFCVLNNVAIAAKQALASGVSRILIVDWDVHAAQGTQECIKGDDRIRLLSIHRFQNGRFWPNLPQSAVRTEFSNTVNVPLNAIGMTDSDYLAICQLVAAPMIQDFRPELILVSCGFDAALGDPEGEMCLTPAGYGTMTKMLINTGIPTAFILEGGYFLESLAADTEFVFRALLGYHIPLVKREPLNPTLPPVIRRVYEHHHDQYPSFGTLKHLTDLLNPTDEIQENSTEFWGQRNVCEPYATRGLYRARPTEVVDAFKEQLDDIVNGYTAELYKMVVMGSSPSGDISISIDEHSITLRLPTNLLPVASCVLQLPLNPLIAWKSSSDSTLPSSTEMARFADFLRQNSHISDLQNIPVYQL